MTEIIFVVATKIETTSYFLILQFTRTNVKFGT